MSSITLTEDQFAELMGRRSNGNGVAVANSTPSASKYVYKSSQPEAEATDKHKFDIVKLLRQKDFSGYAGKLIEIDGSTVDFDEGPISWSDLARTEKSDQTKSGRHYPVIWGLTDGEAVGILNQMIQFPNSTNSGTAAPKNSGYRRNSAPANPVMTETDLATIVAKTVAEQLAAMLPDAQPATPVAATGFSRSVKSEPATPVPAAHQINVGDVVLIDGELWQVTKSANGRPGFRKTIVTD